ncbi:hypothetical protein BG004_002365 [Podila humilis]|nr:hypothetical protein BG004_002365 [Podila humilis]
MKLLKKAQTLDLGDDGLPEVSLYGPKMALKRLSQEKQNTTPKRTKTSTLIHQDQEERDNMNLERALSAFSWDDPTDRQSQNDDDDDDLCSESLNRRTTSKKKNLQSPSQPGITAQSSPFAAPISLDNENEDDEDKDDPNARQSLEVTVERQNNAEKAVEGLKAACPQNSHSSPRPRSSTYAAADRSQYTPSASDEGSPAHQLPQRPSRSRGRTAAATPRGGGGRG